MAEQKAQVKAAQRRAKAGKKVGLKADKALAEDRGALNVTRKKTEQEREARIEAEKGRAGTERAFEEAGMTETDLGEDIETPLKTLRAEGAERRTSFIVRLTVDARGEPRRTEVEDVQSGKKETFAALDGERLTAFMRGCIGTLGIQEAAMPRTSPSVGMGIPKPPGLSASLTVSDVQVLRMGDAVAMALPLRPMETFVVQARFQLQGPDALSFTAQQSAYEMKVYANMLASSESTLLTTYSEGLVKDVLEYIAQTAVPGLSPGVYRLVTLVALGAPSKLAGYHEGPVIRVN